MSNRERTGHPDLLPWFVAGKLDAAEAREVEAHLGACEECAEIAASLKSMSQSLRAAAMEHIGVEELIDWEAGEIRGDDGRTARIEAHLTLCTTCADDLAALRQSRWSPLREGQSRWWLVAAAAAIVIGVAIPIINSVRERPAPGVIVLLPATRSENATPAFDGSKPWTIACVLPFSAPSGEYRVRIEREDGSLLRRLDEAFSPDADARVSFVLEPIEQAGIYRVVLERGDGSSGSEYYYRIQVQR